MEPIYEVHGLCKAYGRRTALDHVDFAVEPGKLVGLLGPNGSGKTTLIKISAGLLTPNDGTVLIDKLPVGVNTKAVTSYLPDRMALPTEFTAADAVSLYDDFFADFDKAKANAMLNDLHLGPHDRIGTMSKGMQEKMQLCLTMSRAAKLYLLDEPLGGVDPAAREYILSTILHNYKKCWMRSSSSKTVPSCVRSAWTSCARRPAPAWMLISGRLTNADETFKI